MDKEKDRDVECGNTLRLEIFNTYWNIMKSNYKDTQHTEYDFKYYYSIFREYEEKDFVNAIKMVLKYQSYFPRIDEIVKFLPKETEKNDVPEWFEQTNEKENATKEEQEEMEKILNDLKGE